MTKVYLVVFKNEHGRIYDFEVFTNKRKAIQYKRYWDAIVKLDEKFKGDTTTIIEQRINNIDYTKSANEKEMKTIPF